MTKRRSDKASRRGTPASRRPGRARRPEAGAPTPGGGRGAGPAEPGGGSCGLCPISCECGSCSRIDVPYARQLEEKQAAIEGLFGDLAKGAALEPILGMERPVRYRNKIASPFAPDRGPRAARGGGSRGGAARRNILCGMYAAGTHRIVPVADCPVEHEVGRKVVSAVRQLMLRHGMEPYDEDAGTGFMRHVVVRVGAESGEVLVTLVTNADGFPGSRGFCRELVRRCPQVTTVVQNVNMRDTNAIFGSGERILHGPGFILDTLCGLSFRISSQSFYQVNAVQTEVLYRKAVEFARMPGGARPLVLMDAYCGTGTIGLVAARLLPGTRVIGVDKVESAIRDARLNAHHNGVGNAEFAVDDAGAFLKRMASAGEALDVLMMDPPRAGATMEFLEAALAMGPSRIVYISCNPATQRRDAGVLAEGGYRLERIQPVDMFPHTDHIENICLFVRDAG